MTTPRGTSRRIEQPADPADVRAVGYGPDEPVRVPEKYAGLAVLLTESGRVDRWNPVLMKPEPLVAYIVDDQYLFVTDAKARVVHAEGWLGWLPAEENESRRNLTAQREAGRPDRQPTDDGGHIFAAMFDGPGEAVNLTAQSRSQNQAVAGSSNWRRMEDSLRALRAAGIQVHAAVDLRHPDATSRRPSARTIVTRHDGRRTSRATFRETPPLLSGRRE